MGGAALATYLKKKGPVLALLCIPPIVGCVILLCLEHTKSNRGPLLAGYYLISVYPGICKSKQPSLKSMAGTDNHFQPL